jgi:hypothetical protein
MTLKIDVSQLADIATAANINGAGEVIERIAVAMDELAEMVARHYQVQSYPAEHMGVEFGGLLVAFGPSLEGQECPSPIREADPDGDW